MSLTEMLAELHDATAKLLLDRIEEGSATAAELGQAINLLKHNGVQAPVTNKTNNALLAAVEEEFKTQEYLQ